VLGGLERRIALRISNLIDNLILVVHPRNGGDQRVSPLVEPLFLNCDHCGRWLPVWGHYSELVAHPSIRHLPFDCSNAERVCEVTTNPLFPVPNTLVGAPGPLCTVYLRHLCRIILERDLQQVSLSLRLGLSETWTTATFAAHHPDYYRSSEISQSHQPYPLPTDDDPRYFYRDTTTNSDTDIDTGSRSD